ncbi:class I SAM-dependent DNA methyltransferase [Xenorhabdus koppenhoeferi]|uniref:Methyltransferase domain-containing protein n=1 Tax=Xenorhabdus koppenhoeferi TaxID=351659 RepID=A0A1I7JXG5_9GAMM|nr:class I SAM-dependent methyltransferase [Xenorhabdus koppenhoeferi]SFU89871.1 Methyltransferase domain-containing protein [Xenorhabdus koppenhoeferi]
MVKKEVDYNSIGESYEQFIQRSPQRALEVRTVLDMVGDVRGKSILDLACGYGYFGRELRKRGASKVVGVDISEKMIELARTKSEQYGDDLEFHVQNVCDMKSFGKFDIVVAVWLFNYAESPEDLETMFQVIADHLKPSGKLMGYTISPEFQLKMGNFDAYGINILSEESWKGGSRYQTEFLSMPPSDVTFYRWDREHYERAIEKAGFKKFEWHKATLLESEIERYPDGFWHIFQQNCFNIGLTCSY